MGRLLRLVMSWLLWAGVVVSASAQTLTLQRLDRNAAASEVLAGKLDDQLQSNRYGQFLFEEARHPVWWKLTVDQPVAAAGQPQLLLYSPYLTEVEAWVPGNSKPSHHALYGRHADYRYSTRALVIALPRGLARDQAVWLRVTAKATVPVEVGLESMQSVHRHDLVFVGWRAFIYGVIVILTVLATTFWLRLRERQYGYFAAILVCILLYLLSMGGEARWIPGLPRLFQSSAQATRVFGCLATFFVIIFQHLYLNIGRYLPVMVRLQRGCALLMLTMAILNALVSSSTVAVISNYGLMLSALMLLCSSIWMAGMQSGRAAINLLLAWLPLMVLAVLRVLGMLGVWPSPSWVEHGLSTSLALSGLLLTIGLADKMLELRRDRDRVSQLAMTDTVTGALSRAAIEQQLEQMVGQAGMGDAVLTVGFMDIDHFKRINDQHGHATGDECLRQITSIIHRYLGETELLGRYGGDEMLLLMPGTGVAAAAKIAEDIRVAIQHHKMIVAGGKVVNCSLSIGIAQWRRGESAGDLLKRADAALYQSKSVGRNRINVAADAVVDFPRG